MTFYLFLFLDRSPDIDNESEDEEESYSSDQENSDSGENLPEAQVHVRSISLIILNPTPRAFHGDLNKRIGIKSLQILPFGIAP